MMLKILMAATLVFLFGIMTLGVLGISGGLSGRPGSSSFGAVAGQAVPEGLESSEMQGVLQCPGLPWAVLGGLGWLASESGRLPASGNPPWWRWPGGLFGIDEAVSLNATDANQVTSAVAVLCSTWRELGSLEGALNQLLGSPQSVLQVNVLATSLSADPILSAGSATVVAFGAGALGLPYQWGGNGPNSYDCSGLVVAAYRAAGIQLPRTAQEQHDVAQDVAGTGSPGDLVFFGSGSNGITHVGIEIGYQLMIDAPETGLNVRIENENWSDLVSQGSIS